MKKAIRLFTVLAMVVTIFALAIIPASASSVDFEKINTENDFSEFQAEMMEDFESKSDWYQQDYENRVGEMNREHEELRKRSAERIKDAKSSFDAMFILGIIIVIIVIALLIAEIAYIYIQAPKCGMSRLWALMPLFSNVLGLIIFIVVSSGRKTMVNSAYNITCPTCSGVHPAGTVQCSICGTKLQ